MDAEYLVEMANDISAFFGSSNDVAKASGEAAGHMRRQWDPRMRRQIIEIWRSGAGHFSDVARGAVALLAAEKPAGG
jgi:formate dehydrogenase subunit delta